jgi:hypothetical protein
MDDLKAENKRLREALKKIKNSRGIPVWETFKIFEIAERALRGKNEQVKK